MITENPNYLKFIMLVGLPASGKSTYALKLQEEWSNYTNKEFVILSSDEVRKDLYGDENIQGDSSEVFRILHDKVIDALKNNVSVIYDATNVTLKNRKSILDKIKEFSKRNNVTVENHCEIVVTPIDKCIKWNSVRERKVPEDVIYSMRNRFQIPLYREGFYDINFYYPYRYRHFCSSELEDRMKNVNQFNPNHEYDLYTHCKLTSDYIDKHYLDLSEDTWEEFGILLSAAYLHDYGKLFTRTFDDNKIAHYYNHENVGAYNLLVELDESLDYILHNIVIYVNYHMIPFAFKNMSDKKKRYYINLFGLETWNNLLLLHEADINSAKEVHNED